MVSWFVSFIGLCDGCFSTKNRKMRSQQKGKKGILRVNIDINKQIECATDIYSVKTKKW